MDEEILNELTEIADKMFDSQIWQNSKERMKNMTKRESSRQMFMLGFFMQYEYMNHKIKDFEKDFKKMTPEDIQKIIDGDKKNEEGK